MIYSDIYDLSRTQYIITCPNYDNNINIGTKLRVRTLIPQDINDNIYNVLINSVDNEKLKDRVILGAVLKTVTTDNRQRNGTLITQQNLNHNIKFTYKDNNFDKPRVLFLKYDIANNYINNNRYLFTAYNNEINLREISLNNISLDIHNSDSDLNGLGIEGDNSIDTLKHLNYYFNYYKNFRNSDYYKFKFSDFIDISYIFGWRKISGQAGFDFDISKNKLSYLFNNVNVSNNFNNNQLINYDISNYTTIFNYNDESLNLVYDLSYSYSFDFSYDNILIFNKVDNLSTVNLSYKYIVDENNKLSDYLDLSINFILIPYKKSGYDRKILINKDYIYINSTVIDYNNNFLSNNNLDLSNVYLSLGNGITGLTQHNLHTKFKFNLNSSTNNSSTEIIKTYNYIEKINIGSGVNTASVSNDLKYKYYLLDQYYDYNYINNTYINYSETNIKAINYKLLNFYDSSNSDISLNPYYSRFNSLDVLNNNIGSINNYYFDEDGSYNSNFLSYYIDSLNDISFSDQYALKINNTNISSLNLPNIYNTINYDFKFNYDKQFYLDIYYNIRYSLPFSNLSYNKLNNYTGSLLLNSHNKIISTTKFITTAASDFTNVDCVFIYHDPDDEHTEDRFKYPYNNIEISNNPNIDTLSRAIELLPGAKTSTTNTTIIPARNGSNLSRKMIEGLIGFNDIPSLLSVEPYNPDVIIGRGFVNQFQIDDTCKTFTDRVADKVNITGNNDIITVNNKTFIRPINRKQNFANIVKGKGRNKLSKICKPTDIQNIDYSTITNINTPFTNPLWRRTHRPN